MSCRCPACQGAGSTIVRVGWGLRKVTCRLCAGSGLLVEMTIRASILSAMRGES
jgi:DnaJ-class molecular chaperone